MPAGPLRETPASGFARADAVVLIGDGPNAAVAEHLPPGLPVLRARLEPRGAGRGATAPAGQHVYAFAGIGRPETFFDRLRPTDAALAGLDAFAAQQPYHRTTL